MIVKTCSRTCETCVNKPLCRYCEKYKELHDKISDSIADQDEDPVLYVSLDCRGYQKKAPFRETSYA